MLRNRTHLLKRLQEEECLLLPDMHIALIGISEGIHTRAVYDKDICLDILEDSMMLDKESAVMYFYTSLIGALEGNKTPLIVETI
tara:strand:- start:396 stop:650 length:255 start_codon:yes stop_codon:yes gene_type:complete